MFIGLCPGPLRPWVHENLPFLRKALPSKSTISRMRLPFDCCWSLWWRGSLRDKMTKHPDMKFTLMADSTPMFGRDWFLVLYEQVDLGSCHAMFEQLAFASGADVDDSTRSTILQGLSSVWEACLDHHIPVPTGIGSKRASLTHKIHNLLHCLLVDLGSWEWVKRFCERVICITADHGVESLLVEAPFFVLQGEFLPLVGQSCGGDGGAGADWAWFVAPFGAITLDSPRSEAGSGDDDAAGEAPPRPAASELVADVSAASAQTLVEVDSLQVGLLFPNALWLPGCMHMLHTVSGEVLKALEHGKAWYLTKLRCVVNFSVLWLDD